MVCCVRLDSNLKRRAAAITHGEQYEDYTTDVCVDAEFTVPKRPSVVDGGQYPYPTPLLGQTDSSGIEGNATDCG
jgi:hypothetical protein